MHAIVNATGTESGGNTTLDAQIGQINVHIRDNDNSAFSSPRRRSPRPGRVHIRLLFLCTSHAEPNMIHPASAMQFAGFRSVIETMWAVDDGETNKITSTFYKHMWTSLVVWIMPAQRSR